MLDKIFNTLVDFFSGLLPSLGETLLKIFIIVTLILITIEILKALKILDFLNKYLYIVMKPLGISQGASMPLLVGLLAGITYGAGAILACSKEMTKKDLILVSVFLSLCHSLIEDTLIFVAVGAKGWLIILARLGFGIIVTMAVNKLYHQKESKHEEIIEL